MVCCRVASNAVDSAAAVAATLLPSMAVHAVAVMGANATATAVNATTMPAGVRVALTVVFGAISLIGLSANLIVLGYILGKRLYKNYVSSHFIGHLCFTNISAFVFLLPVFLYNLSHDDDIWEDMNLMCRLQVS